MSPASLVPLGWDDRVLARYAAIDGPGLVPGRVSRVERTACIVTTADGEHTARAEPLPAVGDWVALDLRPDPADLAALETHLSAARGAARPFPWVAPRLGWLPRVGEEAVAAPVLLAYSSRNRSASCRIPFTSNPKAKRVEVRFPDPMANPYLGFAAMLMAGLDGIKNKIEPHAPVDKDLYELPPDELANIPQVPGSLSEVLDALEKDNEYLQAGNVFPSDLIETWIDYKRNEEILPLQLRPHPHEFELYYDI